MSIEFADQNPNVKTVANRLLEARSLPASLNQAYDLIGKIVDDDGRKSLARSLGVSEYALIEWGNWYSSYITRHFPSEVVH